MEQKQFSPLSILGLIEKAVCIAALVSLVLIAATESLARILGASIPASTDLMIHILLLLGLFSGMYTTKTKEHLSIVLVQYVKNEKVRQIIALATGFIAVFICSIIAGLQFPLSKLQ